MHGKHVSLWLSSSLGSCLLSKSFSSSCWTPFFPLTYPGCAGRQKDSWCKDFKLVRNDHETNEREENNAMIRMSFEGRIYILLLLMMFLFRKYVSDFSSSKWVFFPSRLISESDQWTWTNQPEYSCAPYLVFPTLLPLFPFIVWLHQPLSCPHLLHSILSVVVVSVFSCLMSCFLFPDPFISQSASSLPSCYSSIPTNECKRAMKESPL